MKTEDIALSVENFTTPLQRVLLQQPPNHIDDLNKCVAILGKMVEQYMAE